MTPYELDYNSGDYYSYHTIPLFLDFEEKTVWGSVGQEWGLVDGVINKHPQIFYNLDHVPFAHVDLLQVSGEILAVLTEENTSKLYIILCYSDLVKSGADIPY